MTTDHPVEKLGTKVMNSLDWTVQAFVDARISTEALLQPDAVESILKVLDAKAGWIQEDESKLLLRKALFSVERGKDESLRQYTTRRLAQIEGASAAALVTMPTTTWSTVLKDGSMELADVARALNMSGNDRNVQGVLGFHADDLVGGGNLAFQKAVLNGYGLNLNLYWNLGTKSISISWLRIVSRVQSKIHQDLHVKVSSRNGARCCSQTCERRFGCAAGSKCTHSISWRCWSAAMAAVARKSTLVVCHWNPAEQV